MRNNFRQLVQTSHFFYGHDRLDEQSGIGPDSDGEAAAFKDEETGEEVNCDLQIMGILLHTEP